MKFLFILRRRIFRFFAKNFPWNYARVFFLKCCNYKIGNDVYIGEDILIVDDLDDVNVNIIIGDRVAIAPRVTIAVNSYPNKSILRNYIKDRKGLVLIKNDAWIGTGSIILGGVTINSGAVIAANSVVDKDVPSFTIVGGTPAKEIRKIDITIMPNEK